MSGYFSRSHSVRPLFVTTEQEEQKPGEKPESVRPKPRSGHRCVCDDGQMYVFGGFNPIATATDPEMADDPFWKESRPVFRDMWIYSFLRKRWRKVPMSGPVPAAAVSHALFKKGQYLLCYGGSGKHFGHSSSNTLSVFNLTTNTWSVVEATGEMPVPMYGQGVVVHGNLLYTVGGTTGQTYSNEVHVLDLTTNAWTRLTDPYPDPGMPEPRYRHEVVHYDDKLWVFGGGTAEDTFDLSSIPVFLLNKKRWMKVPANPDAITKRFPLNRRCHSLVQHGEYAYICGGCDSEHIRFTMMWRFDLKTATWAELSCALPVGIYFHSACVTSGGKMYVFGGVREQGLDTENTRTDAMHSVWLNVPSLREMCWEVLTEAEGQTLAQKSRKCLVAAGIPRDMAARYNPVPNQPAVG